jgi:DNA replication protein DnaC
MQPINQILSGASSGYKSKLELAKLRIKTGKSKAKLPVDNQGRYFVNLGDIKKELQKDANKKAFEWHKNNPDIRLDECEFPKNKKDRAFALSHDFGDDLRKVINGLKEGWVFISGDYGNGKTSLAIRVCWEYMKLRYSLRPQFLTVNAWINSLMPGEEAQSINDMRRLVVLDDFDKFSIKKEFQVRSVLRLIEHLIHMDRKVIITANYSITELTKRSNDMDFKVLMDRIRGKCSSIDMRGKSKR